MTKTTDTSPPLSALPKRGDMADARPVVVVDTREQLPLVFFRLESVTETLATGDYSFRGGEELFAVERKSTADLVGCCTGSNRERFERELHRLRGFRFKRLVIVGSRADVEQHRYRSNVSPAAVLGSLAAWEIRFDAPIVWTPTPEDAAFQVESWVLYSARELLKTANGLWHGCSAQQSESVLTVSESRPRIGEIPTTQNQGKP